VVREKRLEGISFVDLGTDYCPSDYSAEAGSLRCNAWPLASWLLSPRIELLQLLELLSLHLRDLSVT